MAGLPSPRGLFVLVRTEVLDDVRWRRSSRRRSPSCLLVGEWEESCCRLLNGEACAEDSGRSLMSCTLAEPTPDESHLPEECPNLAVPDEVRRATFDFTGSLTAFKMKPGGGVLLFDGRGGPSMKRGGTPARRCRDCKTDSSSEFSGGLG